MALMDSTFVLNPITDYAHLAGRGLTRHILPAGNTCFLTQSSSFSESTRSS